MVIVSIDEREMEVIIACIKMAGREGFYLFFKNDIEDGIDTVETVLRKFGKYDREIMDIMDGW